MTHHTQAELLPCPFCGAAPKIEGQGAVRWIKCPDDSACGSGGMAIGIPADDLARGIASWNRRAPAAPVPQGWKLVPDDANMTDEQAEAICAVAKVCGGGAYDIYRAALAAAPKPPEAAPVPQGWKDVAELCAQMCDSRAKSLAGDAHIAAACEARKCASVLRNPPDYWREKLQDAAPQPPEAQASVSNGTLAAPVQLPEPQAEIEVRSMKTYLDLSIHEWRDTLPDGAYNIYTEQQVRELLAAHGIKVAL